LAKYPFEFILYPFDIYVDLEEGRLPPKEKFTVPETEPEMRALGTASLRKAEAESEEKAEFKDML
jgi:hypothetical protein